MSEQTYADYDDVLPVEPNGEIVHWMDPKPLRLGPGGVTVTAASALVIGAAITLGVLAVMHWLGPERQVRPKRRSVTDFF